MSDFRVGLLVGQNVTSGKMWSALGSQLVFYRLPEKVVHGRRVWRKDLDRRRSVIGQQFLHLGGTKAAVVGVPCLVWSALGFLAFCLDGISDLPYFLPSLRYRIL